MQTLNAEYTAFLNCSEALVPSSYGCNRPKRDPTCDLFIVQVTAATATVDDALRLVIGDEGSLRVVVQT